MYEEFFGLNASPFELSPDPFFMFPSEQSKEALAAIALAINRRKGFVVMTGEVGTGKTMMLRCLFELWESEQIPFAYFIGPRLSTVDFLSYITLELGITVAEPSKGTLLRALYGFLLAQFEKGLTTVLVIDEAHQIPRRVLEEIRLLTNFETAQQKLVQILLVGQPELDAKLDSAELRSLKQRIAVRCRLEPLREEEVRDYIRRRLEIAGASPSQACAIFPSETIDAVFRYSLGIPRLVNNICDQALSAACARQLHAVPVEIIDKIASRFRLNPPAHVKRPEKPLPSARGLESASPSPWSRAAAPGFHLQAVKPPDPVESFPDLVMTDAAPAPGAILSEADITAVMQAADAAEDDAVSLGPIPEQEPAEAVQLQETAMPSLPLEPAILLDFVKPLIHDPTAPAGAAPSTVAVEQPAPAKLTANQTAAPIASHRAAYHFERPERDAFKLPQLIRSSLRPGLRFFIVMGLAAVVAAGLMARVSMGRRPKAAVAAPKPVVSGSQNAGESAAVASALPVNAGPDELVADLADPIVPTGGSAESSGKPPGVAARVVPPGKLAMSKLSRPVLKPWRPPAPNDALSILGMQPNGQLLGKGMADIPALASELPRIGGGHLQRPKLLSSPPPTYPLTARTAKVQGVVVIDVFVDETGKVSSMRVLSGSALLTDAAIEAVRRWKYEPARLNGEAIATHTQVSVNFSLH